MQAAGLDAWAVLSGSRCGEGNVVTFLPCRSAGGWFERFGCAPWVSLW